MTARRDARLPFTVLLPDTRLEPIENHDHSVALKMALVEKDAVALLGSEWDRPGVYILLDGVSEDSSFGVYVGKAPVGIRTRLLDHERRRQWARTLLIQRDIQHGLNSAQAGWLEGDLYELFDAADRARLHNTVKPGDDTVPGYDLRILESFRDPIVRVLRLLGYDPATADDSAIDARPKRSSKYHGIGLVELVQAGLLSSGATLVSTNSSWPATALLTEHAEVEYGGASYPTPSGAAAAVKSGPANGWDFWAVETPDGSTRLSALRARYQDDSARPSASGVGTDGD
jgi:hypothetical protein